MNKEEEELMLEEGRERDYNDKMIKCRISEDDTQTPCKDCGSIFIPCKCSK
tara:strand:- start:2715 stop:2867 length:153 start_codon:yes stop_codon:yes gene_type:complete